MKTKRFLIFATPITVAAIISGYLFVILKPQTGHLDGKKITAAVQAYSGKMKLQNQNVPPSVSLQELITKGFLKHEDVSAFDGMEVTVYLAVDETNPQAVLMRARLSDGGQIGALADGSIHQVSK
ncbi:MAG: hypothetical protein HY298_26720 [Verrucomicrobia bacterium]|nr:hypothetical protein [Verrucomicrobiota bacterium]